MKRRVRVFCVRCGVKIGEEEVSDSFRGNALFTLCSKCRRRGLESSNGCLRIIETKGL
jgi:hypothetical protein